MSFIYYQSSTDILSYMQRMTIAAYDYDLSYYHHCSQRMTTMMNNLQTIRLLKTRINCDFTIIILSEGLIYYSLSREQQQNFNHILVYITVYNLVQSLNIKLSRNNMLVNFNYNILVSATIQLSDILIIKFFII